MYKIEMCYYYMFSHIIHNPNNISFVDDFYAIPCGHRCTSAIICQIASVRKFSLPFDWTQPLTPKKIKNVLENDFEDFISMQHKYKIRLVHFNKNHEVGIEEYKRRIERFRNIIKESKKLYFIYVNEDYLYNNQYRHDDFNTTNFNEMLELEEYFKNKNLDYTILYFNYKQHVIPDNSNIINIVLQSELFDREHTAPVQQFRNYCGKILAELLNTNVIPCSYDFNN